MSNDFLTIRERTTKCLLTAVCLSVQSSFEMQCRSGWDWIDFIVHRSSNQRRSWGLRTFLRTWGSSGERRWCEKRSWSSGRNRRSRREMKFNVCGGLDAPDWILAHMATLSKIVSLGFRVSALSLSLALLSLTALERRGVWKISGQVRLARSKSHTVGWKNGIENTLWAFQTCRLSLVCKRQRILRFVAVDHFCLPSWADFIILSSLPKS